MKHILLTVIGCSIIIGAVAFTSDEVTIAGKEPIAALQALIGLPASILAPHEDQTILILGKAGAGWTAGDLTDTILLAQLNYDEQRAVLISIPRDLLVALPNGRTSKINALWTIGRKEGPDDIREQSSLIREAVENVTGIAVDDILVVDVISVAQAIDTLGGIALNVTEHIDDPAFPTPGGGIERFAIEPGFHVLDGQTAVKYARTRHTKEGDFGRVRRQQQVLETLSLKLRNIPLHSDHRELIALGTTLMKGIETTLGPASLPALATFLRNLPSAHLVTVSLEHIDNERLLVSNGSSALVPRAGVFEYTEIHETIDRLLTTK